MKIVFRIIDQWMWLGSVVSMFLLLGVVLLQVFARVALPQVPAWTEEASRFFFMWAVGFGRRAGRARAGLCGCRFLHDSSSAKSPALAGHLAGCSFGRLYRHYSL